MRRTRTSVEHLQIATGTQSGRRLVEHATGARAATYGGPRPHPGPHARSQRYPPPPAAFARRRAARRIATVQDTGPPSVFARRLQVSSAPGCAGAGPVGGGGAMSFLNTLLDVRSIPSRAPARAVRPPAPPPPPTQPFCALQFFFFEETRGRVHVGMLRGGVEAPGCCYGVLHAVQRAGPAHSPLLLAVLFARLCHFLVARPRGDLLTFFSFFFFLVLWFVIMIAAYARGCS